MYYSRCLFVVFIGQQRLNTEEIINLCALGLIDENGKYCMYFCTDLKLLPPGINWMGSDAAQAMVKNNISCGHKSCMRSCAAKF